MTNHDVFSEASTAVAIDRDKNSQHAVRWAVENLRLTEKIIILVHVATTQQNFLPQDCESYPYHSEMHQLFLQHRVFCARKGIRTKEMVVNDHDVANGLSDFIGANSIKNIVLGASSRGVITRAFKNADISTSLSKLAPNFCSIYAVSKGKSHIIKSSTESITALPPRVDKSRQGNSASSSPSERSIASTAPSPLHSITSSDGSSHPPPPESARVSFENSITPQHRLPPSLQSWRHDYSFSPDDESEQQSYASSGISYDEASRPSDASTTYNTLAADLDDELKRMKLELKLITDKYNAACLESQTAREKAKHNPHRSLARCKIESRERVKNALAPSLARCKRYCIDEIEAATNHFTSNKIGEGSYGPVYRATIDHTPVAIKVLQSDISEGLKQFQQEVEVLSRMRHPNMVLLLGACPEYGCLIYEYMENGCLEDRLFCKDNTPPLPWTSRFRIAAEIARGLNFLHQKRPQPLVHRDLKPANILLDTNFVSKIGDVGLSRLVPAPVAGEATQYRMTAAAGTFCYIDPEYQQTGLLGTSSDVYSLGIILLQVITAKPPMGLTHQVETAIEEGRFEEILDQRVKDWPVEETLSLAKLGLKCSELMRKDRPKLDSVVLPELERLREVAESFLRHQRKHYYFTYSRNPTEQQ